MAPRLDVRRLDAVQDMTAVAVAGDHGVPLWRGLLHAYVGEGESGKTWLAALSAHTAAAAGAGVLVIDGEMNASAWKRRLTALGDLGSSLQLVGYAEMSEHAADPDLVSAACRDLAGEGWPDVELIVVDSALSLLSRTARSENDNAEVARIYDRLREIVRRTNTAVLVVDHVARGAGHMVSRGATAKFNALDISYGIRLAEGSVPTRDEQWSSIISIEKDRHGLLTDRSDRAAEFIPLGRGLLQIDVVPMASSSHRLAAANPVNAAIARVAELDPPPTSGNDAHRRLGGTRAHVLAGYRKWSEQGGTGGTGSLEPYRRTTSTEPVRTAVPPPDNVLPLSHKGGA